MSETRMQAATLLCRIFLHYLVLLSEWDGMVELWLKILDIMDRLMNSGQGDNLVSTTKLLNWFFTSISNAIVGRSRPRESEEHPPRHGKWRISGSPVRQSGEYKIMG